MVINRPSPNSKMANQYINVPTIDSEGMKLVIVLYLLSSFIISVRAAVSADLLQFGYYGCYQDNSNTPLMYFQNGSPGSISSCITACQNAGYRFVGLKDGGHCYCDMAIRPHPLLDDWRCDKNCWHDWNRKCGASWAQSVFDRLSCASQPCQNGATCVDMTLHTGEYKCSCASGWTGTHCETWSAGAYNSACDNEPCLNGATCYAVVPDDYVCYCTNGWGGDNCEISYDALGCYVDEVSNRKLTHQAPNSQSRTTQECITYCRDNGYMYAGLEYSNECFCDHNLKPSSWKSGDECEMRCTGNWREVCGSPDRLTVYDTTDVCASMPCKNGATCTMSSSTSYTCQCAPGWEGTNCDIWTGSSSCSPATTTAPLQGACDANQYANVRLLPKPGTGCAQFCQCTYALGSGSLSQSYEWVTQDCGPGTLFDNSIKVCNHAVLVTCLVTGSCGGSSAVTSGVSLSGCDALGACDANQYANVRLLPKPGTGCAQFCQCTYALGSGSLSQSYEWVTQDCGPGTLFDDSIKVCNHAVLVTCLDPPITAAITTTAPAFASACESLGACDALHHAVRRATAAPGTGCAKFCICTFQLGLSTIEQTYKWVEHDCASGTLFSSSLKVCHYHVTCDDTYSSVTMATPANLLAMGYIGCYQDNSGVPLMWFDHGQPGSVTGCIAACRTAGYRFAGMKNGGYCHCDVDLRLYPRLDDSQCNSNCWNDGSMKCGASEAQSVYDLMSCASQPCQNGGTCIDLTLDTGEYKCSCPVGFTGTHCETAGDCDVNTACDTNPCQNGGECIAVVPDDYVCYCTNGWGGYNCTISFGTLGCYPDNPSDRKLEHQASYSQSRTNQECINYCSTNGYLYAGLEYSNECFCDNTMKTSDLMPDTDCTQRCTGDLTEVCGGPHRLTIYETGYTTPWTTPSIPADLLALGYIGCYQDNAGTPLMWFDHGSPGSVTGCIAACTTAGYRFAGLKNGGYCYCDMEIRPYNLLDDSNCNVNCWSNGNRKCGASWAQSVFDLMACASWPCQNGGTCIDIALDTGEYKCSCRDGYNGTNCETSSPGATNDACNPDPCQNGGTCYAVVPDDYVCYCTNGWGGNNCETNFGTLGCYTDNASNRKLTNMAPYTQSRTIEQCIAYCKTNGYLFAGLEYGNECYCDDQMKITAMVSNTDCTMRCPGDLTQACGAGGLISVYETGYTTTSTTTTSSTTTSSTTTTASQSHLIDFGYVGCYQDNSNTPLMWFDFGSQGTVESCINECVNAGYRYAGLKNGGYCFCDVELWPHPKLDDSNCNVDCWQDSSKKCGSSWTQSVFDHFECATKPCENQASCIDIALDTGEYKCSCPTGYSGTNCETSCDIDPCENGGTCYTVGNDNYICFCTHGYGGNTCRTDYGSLGCYEDQPSDRRLTHQAPYALNRTIQECIDYCRSNSYTYAGLEYGNECFCDHQMKQAQLLYDSQCALRCFGNQREVCGDAGTLSVYDSSVTTTTTSTTTTTIPQTTTTSTTTTIPQTTTTSTTTTTIPQTTTSTITTIPQTTTSTTTTTIPQTTTTSTTTTTPQATTTNPPVTTTAPPGSVVNGNWGSWSSMGCSTTCGTGTEIKQRLCDNPAPSGGGSSCFGMSLDVVTCDLGVCASTNSLSSNYVSRCPNGFFTCKSGSITCILEEFRCDCMSDCDDDSDENNDWGQCDIQQCLYNGSNSMYLY
ncbi:Cell wall integrity and stress response component 2 [Mactra antiquata]